MMIHDWGYLLSLEPSSASGFPIFFHSVPLPICFINPKGPRASSPPGVRITLFRKAWASFSVSFQVAPPSVERRSPSSVVIQPRPDRSNATEVSHPEYGVFTDSHVVPPSFVRSNWPANPDMNPLFASIKSIELSDQVAGAVLICCQVLPPSVV